jgi:hypothetical protein
MKKPLLYFVLVIWSLAATWFLRGVYDKQYFGLYGHFQVVDLKQSWDDGKPQPREVQLVFPSGHTEVFTPRYGTYFFELDDTGEGSIRAIVDGVDYGEGGYVTSMNGPQILILGDGEFFVVSDVHHQRKTAQ